MSFITSPGVIVPPLTAGGVAYGTGGQAKVTSAGTAGQALLSAGAGVPTWGTPSISTTANNLAGGSNGTIPYQSASGTTQMLAVGSVGQVLQTNGIAAPSWVTLVPAGVNTFTASGSIAAGSPVQINTNGTVSAPTISTTPSSFTTTALVIADNNQYSSIIYMPSLNVYVCFATDVTTSFLAAKIGTPASDGTVTWGSNIILNAKVGDSQVAAVNCSNLTNTAAIYFYSATDTLGYLYAATITATTITIGTAVSTGIGGKRGAIDWNPTGSNGVCFAKENSTGNGSIIAFTISGTAITVGALVTLSILQEPQVAYDQTSGYFLLTSRFGTFNILPVTVSGTTITTYTVFSTSSYSNPPTGAAMGYVSAAGKVIVALLDGAGANLASAYISMSGSTASLVGGATLSVTSNGGVALGVDNVNNVIAFLYSDASVPKIVSSPVSGTTITYGSPTTLGGSSSTLVGGYTGKLPYNTSQSRILAYYSYTGATFFTNYVTFVTATTTLTAANYIGVSTAAYTNGQTASITTLGGKTTVVTGITAGSIMYASGTGYTTTNSGVVAGRGLSSTSMLVSYS